MTYFVVQVQPDTLMRDDVQAAREEALRQVIDMFIEANGREPVGPYRVKGMCAPVEDPHVTYDGLTVRAHIVQDAWAPHGE